MNAEPTFKHLYLPTLALSIGGWGGLALLLNFTEPTLWPRWTFFLLIIFAVTGTSTPIFYIANKLFAKQTPAPVHVIARRALWAGAYAGFLAWLQVGSILNFSLGLWLALGVIAIETVIYLSEKNTQAPRNVPPPTTPLS